MFSEEVGDFVMDQMLEDFPCNARDADWPIVGRRVFGTFLENGSDVRAFPFSW